MASQKGRPPEFDRDTALRAAMETLWSKGYAATSTDDLLSAMGIARSSFYRSFTSKHAVMLEALDLYTGELLARIHAAIRPGGAARARLRRLLEVLACTDKPDSGCLFVNLCTELLPHDAHVHRRARRHLGEVKRSVLALLSEMPMSKREAEACVPVLLSLSAGAITLRKLGEADHTIKALLEAALRLVPAAG